MTRLALCLSALILAYACNGEEEPERPDQGGELGMVLKPPRGGELNLPEGGAGGVVQSDSSVGRCAVPGSHQCVEYRIDLMDSVEVARARALCAFEAPSAGGAGGLDADSWQEGVGCPKEDALSRCINVALGTTTYHYVGTSFSVEEQQSICARSTVDFELL